MSIILLNLLNEMYLKKLILITKWLNPCLQYDLLSKCLSTVIINRNQKCNPHYQLLIEGKISLRIVYISCMNADITDDVMEVGQRQKKTINNPKQVWHVLSCLTSILVFRFGYLHYEVCYHQKTLQLSTLQQQ